MSAVNVSEYPPRHILKPAPWTWEIPAYFFLGGLAGASATLALGADAVRMPRLARRARLAAAAAVALCPPLLIADLGRPERFFNMLRVLRPTSPMNLGTWLLSAFGASAGAAAAAEVTGIARGSGRLAGAAAGVLGLPLAVYTAVLTTTTAIPAWSRARSVLPFLFVSGAAASAGALAAALTPSEEAGPARRLALAGVAGDLLADRGLPDDYRMGEAGRLLRRSTWLAGAGGALLLAGQRRRLLTVAGAGLVLSGAATTRLAVWKAGQESAART